MHAFCNQMHWLLFRWPFSSAFAFAPVRFKSCSCLYSSRCLRTRAHTSTSPAALTDRPEIASILSHSLGFKSCLYSSRPRPRSFASSWTLKHFFSRPPSPNAAPAARSVSFPYLNTIPCSTALYLCVASDCANRLRQRSPVLN